MVPVESCVSVWSMTMAISSPGCMLARHEMRCDELLRHIHGVVSPPQAVMPSVLQTCSSSAFPMMVTRPLSYCSSTHSLSLTTRGSSLSTGCSLQPKYPVSHMARPAAPDVCVIETLGGLLRMVVVSKIL